MARSLNFLDFLRTEAFADVYAEDTSALHIRWEEGHVDSLSESRETGVGVRILNNDETRFGHISLSSPFDGPVTFDEKESAKRLLRELQAGLPLKAPPLFSAPKLFRHPVVLDPAILPVEEKIAHLQKLFDIAYHGTDVRQIAISYSEKRKQFVYLNSLGEALAEDRTMVVLSLQVTVGRDQTIQTAYEALGGVGGFEMVSGPIAEFMAKAVSLRARHKLDAAKAPLGEQPVVIASSAGGTLIHEAIGHSLEADAILDGSSPSYKGKLGQLVANPKLTVMDNPLRPGARGSYFVDDEGVLASPTVLIENGVLKDYLYDRQSAKKDGRASNGHGRRESYRFRPIPRMSNTTVQPGPDDPRQILADFQNGFLVTKMGGGQVNPANGDFVFEVEEGFSVKDGKKTFVRGATLLGNGPELLKNIDQVGSDQGFAIGTCGKDGQGVPVSDGMPTVHISKMLIGGV